MSHTLRHISLLRLPKPLFVARSSVLQWRAITTNFPPHDSQNDTGWIPYLRAKDAALEAVVKQRNEAQRELGEEQRHRLILLHTDTLAGDLALLQMDELKRQKQLNLHTCMEVICHWYLNINPTPKTLSPTYPTGVTDLLALLQSDDALLNLHLKRAAAELGCSLPKAKQALETLYDTLSTHPGRGTQERLVLREAGLNTADLCATLAFYRWASDTTTIDPTTNEPYHRSKPPVVWSLDY